MWGREEVVVVMMMMMMMMMMMLRVRTLKSRGYQTANGSTFFSSLIMCLLVLLHLLLSCKPNIQCTGRYDIDRYTVWELSSRTEAIKNHTKKIKIFINTVTQYSPHLLPHNVYIAHTTNRMLEKMLFPLLPSVLSSQSVGSMKQPWISSLSSQFLI
jgi:hypothetical protein